jgi:hypothetical protein
MINKLYEKDYFTPKLNFLTWFEEG